MSKENKKTVNAASIISYHGPCKFLMATQAACRILVQSTACLRHASHISSQHRQVWQTFHTPPPRRAHNPTHFFSGGQRAFCLHLWGSSEPADLEDLARSRPPCLTTSRRNLPPAVS